jgi:hypothetical protein
MVSELQNEIQAEEGFLPKFALNRAVEMTIRSYLETLTPLREVF